MVLAPRQGWRFAIAVWAMLAFLMWARAEETGVTRIALLADPHISVSTDERKAAYTKHFVEAIRQINAAKVDLVLIAGDLADRSQPEEWSAFRELIRGFEAPVLFVPGNHDVGPKPNSGKEGTVNSQRYAKFVEAMGPGFWVKEVPGLKVVGITTSLLGSSLPEENEQWSFLEQTLSVPSKAPTVLLTHYPLFVETPDEPGGGYWNVEPAPREKLLSLLKNGQVKAVLSGHLHRPISHQLDGMLFLGAPPISFGLPAGKQAVGWNLITISKDGEIHPTEISLPPNS